MNIEPIQPLQSLEKTPAFYLAAEANIAEEITCFGRGLSGGEVHERDGLTWFYTGRPYLNGVTRTHLAYDDAVYVNQRITEIIDYYTAHRSDFFWEVNPHTNPNNLGTLLEGRGLAPILHHVWMVIDTTDMNEAYRVPPNFVIREVLDDKALTVFRDVSKRGFETTTEQVQLYYDNYLANGFGPGTHWHHYVGYLGDEPVADSSLLLHAGVAGIYGVATIPETRQLGIGSQMTLHALREARNLGYHVAVLVPSDMGINVYRRIGFQEFHQSMIYKWTFEG